MVQAKNSIPRELFLVSGGYVTPIALERELCLRDRAVNVRNSYALKSDKNLQIFDSLGSLRQAFGTV